MVKTRHQQIRHNTTLAIFIAIILLQDFVPFFGNIPLGPLSITTLHVTVIIAAITGRTQTKAKLPTHTEVKDVEGLDRNSIILLEQIRTIDKQRLKNHMGTMPDNIMARVDKALAISLAMTKK